MAKCRFESVASICKKQHYLQKMREQNTMRIRASVAATSTSVGLHWSGNFGTLPNIQPVQC